MTRWLGFLYFGGEICAILVVSLAAYRHGYQKGLRRGLEKGYDSGRVDAEAWWLKQGAEVDKAREAIWKEQG